MGLRVCGLGLALGAAAPALAAAQLSPVGVPAGVVRFEADGALESWDNRWLDGHKRELGRRRREPRARDADLFPFLAGSETTIRQVTGLSGFQINLGALTTDAMVDRGVGMFGLSLGLTRAITVFGRMPLVYVRVQHASSLDPAAANAGANPGSAQQQPFFDQFDGALSTLSARIAAGDYAGDPATLALAQSTLASAHRAARRPLRPAERSRDRQPLRPPGHQRRRCSARRPHRRTPDHPRDRARRRRVHRSTRPAQRPAHGRGAGGGDLGPDRADRDAHRRIEGDLSRRRRGGGGAHAGGQVGPGWEAGRRPGGGRRADAVPHRRAGPDQPAPGPGHRATARPTSRRGERWIWGEDGGGCGWKAATTASSPPTW